MKISDKGLDLIKHFEGYRSTAYQDSGGVWTIGYGHTFGVKEGDTCDEENAAGFLRQDVEEAEHCVTSAVATVATQWQFDAMVSLAYNIGCRNFRNSSVIRSHNLKLYLQAALSFHLWDKADGQVVHGLIIRRNMESQLYQNENFNLAETLASLTLP